MSIEWENIYKALSTEPAPKLRTQLMLVLYFGMTVITEEMADYQSKVTILFSDRGCLNIQGKLDYWKN